MPSDPFTKPRVLVVPHTLKHGHNRSKHDGTERE